jgi:hypothetical protein
MASSDLPAVAVFIPVPSPAMTRPAYCIAAYMQAAWTIAPIAIVMLPSIKVRGRPSLSPVYNVDKAPAKHPKLYTDVIVPVSRRCQYTVGSHMLLFVLKRAAYCELFGCLTLLSDSRVSNGPKKVVANQNVAKNALIIAVKNQHRRRSNRDPYRQLLPRAS